LVYIKLSDIQLTFTLELLQHFSSNTLTSGIPLLSFQKCHTVPTLNHPVMAKCNKQHSEVKGKVHSRTGHDSPYKQKNSSTPSLTLLNGGWRSTPRLGP